MPTIHIVIPVFNGWAQTRRCLQTLAPGTGTEFTVVVVDHGSTDATPTELPRLFPRVVHLLDSDELWWTGATNVGIRYALEAGADFVIPLNNDCFLEPAAVARLVGYAQARSAIVAPVQRAVDTGEVLAVSATPGVALGFPTLRVDRSIDPAGPVLRETRLIMGGRGAVIGREVFASVGLFAEEELPHYLADHDFYLRCRRQGVRLLIAQDVSVLVDETRTSVAAEMADMTWAEFRRSLTSPRSHRNLAALRAFFRRNYPVRFLWPIGVFLNLGRFSFRWGLARLFRRVGNRS
jgi:GT2 family glycosyltransferase